MCLLSFLIGCFPSRLAAFLPDWLRSCLINWLFSYLFGCFTTCLAAFLSEWLLSCLSGCFPLYFCLRSCLPFCYHAVYLRALACLFERPIHRPNASRSVVM